MSATPHFQFYEDVAEYLASCNGGDAKDYKRDDPETIKVAERHGVGAQVAKLLQADRELHDYREDRGRRLLAQSAKLDSNVVFDCGEPGVPKQRTASDRGARLSTSTWPPVLDLEALAERTPSPPRSLMQGLPIGYATLIAGHGGAGKSSIALYLIVCIATGRDFFGLPVERRRVLLLSCEDRADVLHWRLSRICAYLDIDLAGLRGWLDVIDLVGRDTILWGTNPRTGAGLTAAYGELAERMHEREVLVVDGISDTFNGNENDRGQVKAYVNALLALIPPDTGALVLVGHVSKSAAGGYTSEGYSGSTGWHNSVRARWYLRPEARDGDEADRADHTGALVLDLQKANHGDTMSIRFRWDDTAHLFVGEAVGGASHFDRVHEEREELGGILNALRASTAASVVVPAATTGRRTAFHVLSAREEFPASLRSGKPALRRFWRHVEALRQRGDIRDAEHKRPDGHRMVQMLAIGQSANVK